MAVVSGDKPAAVGEWQALAGSWEEAALSWHEQMQAVWVASASVASEVDGLLDLLVKKGVVTQEEASGLRQELEAQKKAGAVTAQVPVRITGYAQIRATAAEGESDSFLIRRARLSLLGDIAPGWDYKLQADCFITRLRRGHETGCSKILALGLHRFITDTTKLQVNYERRADESKNTTDNALLAQLQARF